MSQQCQGCSKICKNETAKKTWPLLFETVNFLFVKEVHLYFLFSILAEEESQQSHTQREKETGEASGFVCTKDQRYRCVYREKTTEQKSKMGKFK